MSAWASSARCPGGRPDRISHMSCAAGSGSPSLQRHTPPSSISRKATVAFREMDEGGVWRCSDGEPEPAAQLMCDIRSGRPPGQRAELAQALIEACTESLGLSSNHLGVEFTQHTGDEMYRAERGFAANWTPAKGRMP